MADRSKKRTAAGQARGKRRSERPRWVERGLKFAVPILQAVYFIGRMIHDFASKS